MQFAFRTKAVERRSIRNNDRQSGEWSGGVTYANLHMGNALPTFSETGCGYAVEKAPSTKCWTYRTYPVFDELWNYGFPEEMRHFARCVRGQEQPIAGHDGRVGMEALYAAYAFCRICDDIADADRPLAEKRRQFTHTRELLSQGLNGAATGPVPDRLEL